MFTVAVRTGDVQLARAMALDPKMAKIAAHEDEDREWGQAAAALRDLDISPRTRMVLSMVRARR